MPIEDSFRLQDISTKVEGLEQLADVEVRRVLVFAMTVTVMVLFRCCIA